MDEKEKNKKFYEAAYNFLRDESSQNDIDENCIKLYLSPISSEKLTLNHIYYQLAFSAQNRQQSNNVIGGAIGGVEKLGKVLGWFDVNFVRNEFGNDDRKLLGAIQSTFIELKNINQEPNGLWPQYCKSLLSGAEYLSSFNDGKAFVDFVNRYHENVQELDKLPELIEEKVFGFGIALACDFLKELGFVRFGKPDVHIKDILSAYGFISGSESDLEILNKLQSMAEDAGVSCYAFDKVLWLIGSGKFYKHGIKINGTKDGFMQNAKSFLENH